MTGKEMVPVEEVAALKRELEAVRKQSIAALGDGEVFVRRTPKGQIQAVRGAIKLLEANGELAEIQKKIMTTGKGFYKANQITSLSIITPQKLTLPDGSIVVNPYPILDEKSTTVRKFWVKKLAVGYGPIGNLVITSVTLLYDLNMYFIQDLFKKVKNSVQAGRVCFESQLTDGDRKTGIFYAFDGDLGVWANVNNADILKCIDTFINKKQFAERNAQTICERLAFAKHPALSHIASPNAVGKEGNHVALVSLVGYINDFDKQALERMAVEAEREEDVLEMTREVAGQDAEIVTETTTAKAEDVEVEDDDESMMQRDDDITDDDVPARTMQASGRTEQAPDSLYGSKVHSGGGRRKF